MKGVTHYLASGKIYPAFLPTHKDSKGRLMTGKTHSSKSVSLYHSNELKKKK